MRANRSKTGKRRSHAAISGERLATCECGHLRISHRACPNCGKYNGLVVIDVVGAAKRAARRTKRKQTALRESGRDTESTTNEKEEAKT